MPQLRTQRTSLPARRTWRQAEVTRHRTLANLVQDLANRCRTQSMPPVSPLQPPTGRNPRVARTPLPSRPQRITATQARRGTPRPGRRHHRANLHPTGSPKPG